MMEDALKELEDRVTDLEFAGARDTFLIGQLTIRLIELDRLLRGEKSEDEGGTPTPLEDMLKTLLDGAEGRLFG